jgi:nifR3 family TIM-barrel protein
MEERAGHSPFPRPPYYHPVQIGSLAVPGNLFLAPVAGYSDRAFRSLCVEQGADLTCTELASAEALVRGSGNKTRTLLQRAANEERCAIQLFGGEPELMYRAACLLAPLQPEVIDINAGCPVPKVIKTGAGAALTRSPAQLARITAAVVRASRESLGNAPVTVKIRSGWDAASITCGEAARAAAEHGAALVTLHPRTRAQGYEGKSDWSLIADMVSRLPVPVAGSGDLFSPEDAERMLRETGCAAVMFARGAMGNPFIFTAARSFLTAGSYIPPSPQARIAAGLRHLELLAADLGERGACLEMRKHFCAYTRGCFGGPGIPRGAALRDRLVRAQTIAEYREITAGFIDPT